MATCSPFPSCNSSPPKAQRPSPAWQQLPGYYCTQSLQQHTAHSIVAVSKPRAESLHHQHPRPKISFPSILGNFVVTTVKLSEFQVMSRKISQWANVSRTYRKHFQRRHHHFPGPKYPARTGKRMPVSSTTATTTNGMLRILLPGMMVPDYKVTLASEPADGIVEIAATFVADARAMKFSYSRACSTTDRPASLRRYGHEKRFDRGDYRVRGPSGLRIRRPENTRLWAASAMKRGPCATMHRSASATSPATTKNR